MRTWGVLASCMTLVVFAHKYIAADYHPPTPPPVQAVSTNGFKCVDRSIGPTAESCTATASSDPKPHTIGPPKRVQSEPRTTNAYRESEPATKIVPPNPNAVPPPTRLPSATPAKLPELKKPDVKTVLTTAVVIALILRESREAYYSTGRPCACPDDHARNGSRCGARSANSRRGGAHPLCYPSEVTAEMIADRKQRVAER